MDLIFISWTPGKRRRCLKMAKAGHERQRLFVYSLSGIHPLFFCFLALRCATRAPARKNPYPRRRIHRRCGHRALSVYPFRLIVIPTFVRHLPRFSEPFSMGIVSKETRLGDCWRVFLPRLSSSSIIWALSSAICSMGSFR